MVSISVVWPSEVSSVLDADGVDVVRCWKPRRYNGHVTRICGWLREVKSCQKLLPDGCSTELIFADVNLHS